jgi:hypothetical protein
MSCREFSGVEQNGLRVNDFAMRFETFEVGSALSVSAFKDRAKKYATRHIPGTIGDIGEAKAGHMFDVEVVWIENIENTRKNFPMVILKTEDDYIVCLIDKEDHSPGLRNLAWGMIISPFELIKPPFDLGVWLENIRTSHAAV